MELTEFVDQLYNLRGEVELGDAKVFVDRLLLRIFDAVSLMQYLDQVSVLKKGDVQTVQLVFSQLPQEVLPDVQRIIGIDSQCYNFEREGVPYAGFEIPLDPELFNDDANDAPVTTDALKPKEDDDDQLSAGLANLSAGFR